MPTRWKCETGSSISDVSRVASFQRVFRLITRKSEKIPILPCRLKVCHKLGTLYTIWVVYHPFYGDGLSGSFKSDAAKAIQKNATISL